MEKKFLLKKKSIAQILIAFIFIFPYIEIRVIRDILEYKYNGVHIPASISIMILLLPVLLCFFISRKKIEIPLRIKKIIIIKLTLDIILFLRGFYVENYIVFITQFLWFVVPFWFSTVIYFIILKYRLNIIRISKIGIAFFTFYLVVNILINIFKYGFVINNGVIESRLLSTGGGPVILGYTIVVILIYLLSIKKDFKLKWVFYLNLSILLLGSLFTGSRGSIWPVLMILIIYFLIMSKNKIFNILNTLLLIAVFLIFNPIAKLGDIVPRAMNFDGGIREVTFLNSINIMPKQNLADFLFGTGLGNFFPYSTWFVNGPLYINLFYFDGKPFLVQPHNSFVYLLVEAGLIGVLLFTILLLSFIPRKIEGTTYLLRLMFVLFVILLNNLDSIFIVQPSTSVLWWLLLLFVANTNKSIIEK